MKQPKIQKRETLTGVSLFGFYRIETASADYMLTLVRQLICTYIHNGSCTALVDINSCDFRSLVQLFRDMRLRYWSARRDSSFCKIAAADELAVSLSQRFPDLDFCLPGKNHLLIPK